jgi:hypothetical protein
MLDVRTSGIKITIEGHQHDTGHPPNVIAKEKISAADSSVEAPPDMKRADKNPY